MDSTLRELVAAYVSARGERQGLVRTTVPGLEVITSDEPTPRNGIVYTPSLCITVQGAKEVVFGEKVFAYGPMEFLLVSMEIPAFGRVTEATADRPYLGIAIDLDPAAFREVLDQLDTLPMQRGDQSLGVFHSAVDEDLANCITRFVRLIGDPKAAPILAPLIQREICYRLLAGPDATAVCKLVMPNGHARRIVEAIHVLRDNYIQPVRIEQLAAVSRMSPASFHQHFKTLRSMTPLQYQKQLRLLEARRLIASGELNVAYAAYQVGYESPSQFSREYARMFGTPPKRDFAGQRPVAA